MSDKYEDREKDIFGLPKLHIDAELGVSFTLLILGVLVLFSVAHSVGVAAEPAFLLGILLIATSYIFVVESVRELEEKDHFLSRRLMQKKEDNKDEEENEEE